MSASSGGTPEQLQLQSELIELRQRIEFAGRQIAELEQSQRRLTTELNETRAAREKAETRAHELNDLLSRNAATGLPIRRIFDGDCNRLIEEVARQVRGPIMAVGLLRLDNDYSKIKNTRDRTRVLLFKTADRIREIIGDNIYQSDRLDEFLLIFRNMPNVDGVELRADQIVEAVSTPHEPPADDVRFSCFLGIAIHPQHGDTREDLLGNADIALNETERANVPYTVYSPEMGQNYRERAQLEARLKAAIHSGFEGFDLNYQPFVDPNGAIVGCEVLIRWEHSELGPISPDRFVPISEENGSVRFLGQWTLYRACRQLKIWHSQGYDDLYVSVNLSPSQFKQIDLVERIAGILASLGLEGSFLKLELTETTVMDDPEEAISKMNELRAMGVRLALDDFGTGYSSLSYLRRFQFDTLKIDRSFITDIQHSRNGQEIVRAIIAMAQAFGMQTLAEGVETADELEFLFTHGCDLIQGYYFSPGVNAEHFTELLENGTMDAAVRTPSLA